MIGDTRPSAEGRGHVCFGSVKFLEILGQIMSTFHQCGVVLAPVLVGQ